MGRHHVDRSLLIGVATALGWLASGCGVETTDSGDDLVPEVDRATCEKPVGGLPWDDSPEGGGYELPDEADTGLQLELAATDFGGLPESVDITGLIPFYKGLIGYALDLPEESRTGILDRDEVLASGPMGEVVLASILQGGTRRYASNRFAFTAGFDFVFYRRGLFRYYTCSLEPPLTLEDFKVAVLDFTELDYTDVDSIAKCGIRRLYLDHDAQVYVTESLVEGVVRETEILLTGTRQDGNIDFLVYDADGLLTDRTQFPQPNIGRTPHGPSRSRPTTSPGSLEIRYEDRVVAAPYICMSCHVDRQPGRPVWAFDLLVPTSGPCPSN